MEQNNTIIGNDEFKGLNLTEEERDTLRRVKEKYGKIPATLMPAVTYVTKDPDDIVYLLIMKVVDEYGDDYQEWKISVGRQATFDYLINNLKADAIDINKSFICPMDNKLDDSITVFRFLKVMIDGGKVILDKDFDIDIDYYDSGEEDLKLMEA